MTMRKYWGLSIRGLWVSGCLALLVLSAPAQDATTLALGSRELESKQYQKAIGHLETAFKRAPQLGDYAAYLRAAALFEIGNYREIERAVKPVWDRMPPSPLTGKATILLANAYLRANEPHKAITLVQQHAGDLKPQESEILLGHAFDAAGDRSVAKTHFDRVLIQFPLTAEGTDAASEPARLQALSPKDRLTRCIHMLDSNHADQARKELEEIEPRLEGADLDLARVKSGAAQYMARSNAPAFAYLKTLQVTSPEADAERLYYLVRCARRLDRTEEIQTSLNALGTKYSNSQWRLQALLAAGDYFWLRNDVAAYEPIYRTCSDTFGEPDCQWRAAWVAYRQRRPEARALFEVLLKQNPTSEHVPNAMYFLARIAESANDAATARGYYEQLNINYTNYYYGMLARERLKTPAVATAGRVVAFTPSAQTQERCARARLLAAAALDDLAESELRFGAKNDGQPEIAAAEFAELAAQRGAPELGIRFIKQLAPNYLRLRMDAASEKFLKLAFPLPFRTPLELYSKAQGLDPFLVAALIRQESEFNSKVISRARAYGLTQVLPSTGREVGRKLNLRGFQTSMLFRPEVNLQIGTYFLRSLLDRLEGKWELTLASYNAGPGRVAKWLTWGDYREPAEFIETIPFDETRGYVQSVLRNADLYRRLYGAR